MERSPHRRFLSYIDKSRDYYAAQGFDNPYGWATGNAVPFTQPRLGLEQSTVALVTTAAKHESEQRKLRRHDASISPPAMATQHLSWHKTATNTDDVGSFLPLGHLGSLVDAGVVGGAGPNFYSVGTLYSHRRTLDNANELVSWLSEDGVDIVVLAGL